MYPDNAVHKLLVLSVKILPMFKQKDFVLYNLLPENFLHNYFQGNNTLKWQRCECYLFFSGITIHIHWRAFTVGLLSGSKPENCIIKNKFFGILVLNSLHIKAKICLMQNYTLQGTVNWVQHIYLHSSPQQSSWEFIMAPFIKMHPSGLHYSKNGT